MSAYQGSMCGSGAFGYGLTHLKEALLVLPIAGFFLISRCTGRAHETSEVTERFDFSLQFIIGAQENFHLKSFISLIYFGLTRPSNGLDRLGNPARANRGKSRARQGERSSESTSTEREDLMKLDQLIRGASDHKLSTR